MTVYHIIWAGKSKSLNEGVLDNYRYRLSNWFFAVFLWSPHFTVKVGVCLGRKADGKVCKLGRILSKRETLSICEPW